MRFETILTPSYLQKYQSLWPNQTILDYLANAVKTCPNQIAIVDHRSRYTYGELKTLVDRVALGLLEMGMTQGDVISIQLPNWNEFVILYLAATRIGAITNPLVPIYRDREIGFMVQMVEAKMLVIPDHFRGFHYPEMVQRLLPQWPTLRHVFVLGENVPADMKSLSFLFDEPWEKLRDVSVLDEMKHDVNDITEIIFTSGTTGEPKGVMHTHNTLLTAPLFWIEHLNLTSVDTIFMASTFAHQTGFLYGILLPLMHQGTGVYQDIWNPKAFIAQIEAEQITYTTGSTPFLQDTLNVENIEQYNLSSLRFFVAVGAPIPRTLVKQAQTKLPCRILSGWGQTENGMVTLTMANDSDEKLTLTDGKPFPSMRLRVVDGDDQPLPPDTEGDLQCQGPALFAGYFKRIEQTRCEFHDGWFVTGDRACMDKDGYIRITGRNKDIIIRGGENIPVAYVENALYEHPDISIAQIVSMPDTRLQEKACAFICMKPQRPPLSLEKLQAFLAEKGIAKPYWPERVEIIDEFPRTPSGKIQKFQLRNLISKMIDPA